MNSDIPINIEFDPYGNLYFIFNEKEYQLNINGKNEPYLEPFIFKNIEKQTIPKIKYRGKT